jgi:hypothetical protein
MPASTHKPIKIIHDKIFRIFRICGVPILISMLFKIRSYAAKIIKIY